MIIDEALVKRKEVQLSSIFRGKFWKNSDKNSQEAYATT